jgi:4-carboxymuconolactone decarboxylase
MPETPTFGRYAERPYDQMTPEQRQGYRALIETCGRGRRAKNW